jgi:signal transduction histidine kinase/plastocyanin/HAMP domain-containing protein
MTTSRLFGSLRAKIFAAFLAMSAITAGLGLYCLEEIRFAGAVVVDTFDGPLQSVNFARSAAADFARLLGRMTTPDQARGADSDELADALREDLRIASERALSDRARRAATELGTTIRLWDERRRGGSDPAALRQQAEPLFNRIDALVEYTLADAFKERAEAVRASTRSLRLAGVAAIGALLLSAAIAIWLAFLILRPLRQAAAAADRVAAGDFEAPIPQGGSDETGILLRSMHVMQANIRELVERERAFRRSAERRLIDALEGARQGVVLLDRDDRVVLANAQARGFFPRPAGSLVIGERFVDAFPHEACVGNAELQLDDDRWIRVARSTTVEGDVFLFWSDVSELKQREVQLMRAKAQAEGISAAKSRFLETMSHELRTPLHAMIGFSEMLEQAPYGPLGHADYEDWSHEVLRGGKRLADVVDKVLLLTKVEGGGEALKFDVQDLGRLAAACVSAAQGEASEALVELYYEGPAAPVAVMIEGQKLRQALRDLISNAIKFNKPGGRVDVRLSIDAFDLARLDVIDTGIGMTEESIVTAREPFGQVDASLSRSFEGVGLGLPLAEALIKMHGGQLDIESEYGVGTTVTVLLPLAASESAAVDRRRGTFGFASIVAFSLIAGQAMAADVPISQQGRRFAPNEVTVKVGDTIVINNDDEFDHHVQVPDDRMKFDSGENPIGKSVRVKFPVAGTFDVGCAIHPKMKLVVTVK